ncbi:MAG: SprT family zinc-dependent metalloprotease [Rhodospirillales bacterium]|nr:SprT family zinc-dependent metalloprotease [Rhodospirillales bacterium]
MTQLSLFDATGAPAFAVTAEPRRLPASVPAAVEKPESGVAYASRRIPELMARHGLTAAGWGWVFDGAKTRAGACHYTKRRIQLARRYCEHATREQIDDTILHEIAHALAGHQAKHGPKWKAIARSIGCSAVRCHDVTFTPPKYLVECPNGCFTPHPRQRRPRRSIVCRKCSTRVVTRPA